MKKLLSGCVMMLTAANSQAVKLSDYQPFIFEPLFTNPVCQTYKYDRGLLTDSGKTIESKPTNVYCKSSDEAASVARKDSPQYRLKEWISSAETKELYLAYLSFSSKAIASSLCEAAKRGVKINMVLDSGETNEPNKDAELVKKCGKADQVKVTYRGETGGLGYAHNKIMIVNPGQNVVKIVFSSGNMSSGTSTNHENWNFITTSGKSYFAQTHKCVVDGMVKAGDTKKNFTTFMTNCRVNIQAPPETDIKVYFAPVDGKEALAMVAKAAGEAQLVEAMSHRFSGDVARLFGNLLSQGKNVKFILDDDIYWAFKLRKDVGRNSSIEAFKLYKDLINKGMETRFLQTNQQMFQLQHNKLIVFSSEKGPTAVFNGAGNFTSAAFSKNFENFYYITIPSVVVAYKKQYDKYFNEMATIEADMPRDYVLP